MKWGENHNTEFLKKYRDQWIAIENKKVIASGNNLEKVEKEAKQKTGKEWVPVIFIQGGEHIYGQS
ncbi:hypothetical protein HYV89_02415 [Candidatus Woesearchaeota archaeon]|nr:hypothetical protein [Candidatus Woesearchaeota archaeon]